MTGLTVALVTASVIGPSPAPATASPPKAAVAMGDSFIAGEGAGNYDPVYDVNGVVQGFPGWAADNHNAYFCHRSANASIRVADLPDIDAAHRYNLACSGGQPFDITNPSRGRPGDKGREVAAQIEQLRRIASDPSNPIDIDVVLIGVSSNTAQYTYGDVAKKCIGTFITDAYVNGFLKDGNWFAKNFEIGHRNRHEAIHQSACLDDDFPTSADLSLAENDSVDAVRAIAQALEEIDTVNPHHTIILQDYTDPLPMRIDPSFYTERVRGPGGWRIQTDEDDRFEALANKRYTAGCPAHLASLVPAHKFTRFLGNSVRQVRDRIHDEFPNLDIRYMNVQNAFDGRRICERPDSPSGAFLTPVRFSEHTNGYFAPNMNGWRPINVQRADNTCHEHYQTCQESLHPNALGQQALGKCLTLAVTGPFERVRCQRNPQTGELTITEFNPSLEMYVDARAVRGEGHGRGQSAEVTVTYNLVPLNSPAPLFDTQTTATVGTSSMSTSLYEEMVGTDAQFGSFTFSYPCFEGDPVVNVNGSTVLDGRRLTTTGSAVVDMSAACN